MESWRVVADSYYFDDEQDSDPHQEEKVGSESASK
jgi:hypothetical protein